MGKKNKPIDDGFNTIDQVKPTVTPSLSVIKSESTFEGSIVSENFANDIQKYEDLQQQNIALLKENNGLIEKLGNYITELNQLKDLSANSFKTTESSISSESSIQLKVEQLQKLNDEYLTRISQLTFENASLKSQVSELSKNSNENTTQPQPTCEVSKPKIPVLPTKSQSKWSTSTFNGYSSWN